MADSTDQDSQTPFNLSDLKLEQLDGDTYWTQPLEKAEWKSLFKALEENGINANAYTRPRDVPPDEAKYADRYAQAVFISEGGRVKMDISVVQALQEQFGVEVAERPLAGLTREQLQEVIDTAAPLTIVPPEGVYDQTVRGAEAILNSEGIADHLKPGAEEHLRRHNEDKLFDRSIGNAEIKRFLEDEADPVEAIGREVEAFLKEVTANIESLANTAPPPPSGGKKGPAR